MVACDTVLRANFHGDNTGSNPVGDANNTNNLAEIPSFAAGPVRISLFLRAFSDWKTRLTILLRLRVEVHAHTRVGMPQQLLHCLHVLPCDFRIVAEE